MENKSKYNSVASLELKAQKGAKDGSINQEKKNKTRKDNNQKCQNLPKIKKVKVN